MKYEFIKIENTTDGMMAYLLDHERGVIVIAPVEYLGESAPVRSVRVPTRRVEYVEEEPEVIRRPVRRTVVVEEEPEQPDNGLPDAPAGGRPAGQGMRADGLRDIGHSKPSKANTIMPPHLRGVMKKDKDIESRETLQ